MQPYPNDKLSRLVAALTVCGRWRDRCPGLSVWVGVATTLAAALAAHLASEQHARIAVCYALTTDDLDRLINRFDAATADQVAATAFVIAVEAVLARQNESWVSIFGAQRLTHQ